MYVRHLDALQPVCPACRLYRGQEHALRLTHVAREENEEILEGCLVCSNASCQREHPILDGIPVLLADPTSWITTQMHAVLQRDDLTDFTWSLLGDLAGAGSPIDRDRGNTSTYMHSHWAQHTPSYLDVFVPTMELTGDAIEGAWLDLGCAMGRGVLELARRGASICAGVDLNFSMLRAAQRVRRGKRVEYGLRRVGLVFDSVGHELDDYPLEQTGFWCADLNVLPFAASNAKGALACNVLDCVPAPTGLLSEMGRVLRPGGAGVLATPFDWAAGATPAGAWIGGHSQRSAPGAGSSLEVLRMMLPQLRTGLRIEAERDGIVWRLRTNERSTTEYSVYAALLRRDG